MSAVAARLFAPEAQTVQEGVACTWCAASLGSPCIDGNRLGDRRRTLAPHAQRWRDYWNATHDKAEHVPVYPAPWLNDFLAAHITPPTPTQGETR